MEVKIVYHFVLSDYFGKPEYLEKNMQINETTTLKDINAASGQVSADFSNYYKTSKRYYHNQGVLPYILKTNGEIIWEPTYDEVTVLDFLYTHSITNKIIYGDTGIPQAGGPDLKTLLQLWNDYIPIIDQISTFFSLALTIGKAGLFLKTLFVDKRKKPLQPQSLIDFILSKNTWNHHELSKIVDIKPEEAKAFLNIFGYQWDNSKKLYFHSGDLDEIKEKFARVQFWEHG